MSAATTAPTTELLQRLQRLLRWRLWVREKLQLTEWQVTLLWAALAGFLGAGGALGLPQGADLYVPSEYSDRARELLNDVFDGI